jgi:uncharacterized protein (TIGR03437 family)
MPALALLGFLFAGVAQANLLVNGSFESPVVPIGGGLIYPIGSTGITGWTVVGLSGFEVEVFSGSLTLSGFNFPAEDGNQWLDLTGAHSNNIEGVSQSVSTVLGKTYTLTFWVGNVSGGALGVFSSVGLKINGTAAENFTNSMPGTILAWQKFSYSFIATSSTTIIEFDNLDPLGDGCNGLDNVDLEEGGTASPLPVNLLANGDFETPVVPTGGGIPFNPSGPQMPGWTVVGTAGPNTVGPVSGAFFNSGFYGPAENGHQWMDLTGQGYSTGTRGITQTVPTVTGSSYSLSFWVGNLYDLRNPASVADGQNFGTTSTVGVKINGVSAGNFTNSAQATILEWQQFSLTFTATADSTAIEFDNLDPPTDTCNGLDNVILQQIAAPSISLNGVVSASDYGKFPETAPGSQIEIYGSNLARDVRGWSGGDFTNGIAPTSLDSTFVTIGGKAAFVDYISPGQVNVVVPSDVPTGLEQLTVTTAAGTSSDYEITVNSLEPGLLAPAAFNIGGTQYVAAFFPDNSAALPTGAIAGLPSHPAKPGDVVTLYGIGFGPVIPNIPAGQIVDASNKLASSFAVSIGGKPASVQYAGLAPNYTGLYQINLVVPNVSGNAPLTFTLGATAGIQTLYLSVEN